MSNSECAKPTAYNNAAARSQNMLESNMPRIYILRPPAIEWRRETGVKGVAAVVAASAVHKFSLGRNPMFRRASANKVGRKAADVVNYEQVRRITEYGL